jgi:hypothetical protein
VGAEGCVWFGFVGAPPAASPFFHPLRVGTPKKRAGLFCMSFMVSIVFNRFKLGRFAQNYKKIGFKISRKSFL